MVISEGVCTFLLSAFYTVRDADFGVQNFALWPIDERNHLGLCSHSPLSESRGAVMDVLSDQEVEELLAARKANQARRSKKYCDSDESTSKILYTWRLRTQLEGGEDMINGESSPMGNLVVLHHGMRQRFASRKMFCASIISTSLN